MKLNLPVAFTVGLVLASIMTLAECVIPYKAKCQYCYAGPCYDSATCGRGCSCMKIGSQPAGQCVSLAER